jgi:LysM repeat protein
MPAPVSRATARDGLLARLRAIAIAAPLVAGGAGCASVTDWVESIRWQPQPDLPRSPASYRPSSPERRSQVYLVRPGDTLWSIGERNGVSVVALARANRLADADRIEVGQPLWIPRPGERIARARPSASSRAAQPARARAALETRLERAGELLRTAHFEEALAEAERARPSVAALEAAETADSGAQRARLEILAATASVALGDDAAAAQSFERALAGDPTLRLDPARFSPKLIRRFEQTRLRLARDLPVPERRLADLAAP